MKFSVLLPQTNQVATAESMLRTALAAERLGYEAVAVHDHIVFDGWFVLSGSVGTHVEGDRRTLFEPLETLAYLAARTERVRLLTSIIALPLREPILFAKQTATLDALSGGRLILGVGVGPPRKQRQTVREGEFNPKKEYMALGVRGDRGKRMDEYIRAVISIWTEDRASFAGEHVAFEEIEVFPKPVQRPRPPIWIGGRSDAAIARAAALGDAWSPSQISAQEYAAGVAMLRSLRGSSRAAPSDYPVNLFTCIADTDQEADELAWPALEPLYPDKSEYRARTVVGSASTFVERVREYKRAGATFLNIYPIYHDTDEMIDQLERVAREVMPSV